MATATDRLGTVVRQIDDLAAEVGLQRNAFELEAKHNLLDAAYGNRSFRTLVRLARDLIATSSIGEILEKTLAVAFETLPIHRGIILLRQPTGELVCEIVRVRDKIQRRPSAEGLVSQAILDRVIEERVAIVTQDALEDQRFAASDSIWSHGIRAAMCVPLWADDRIIGFMQVDSPIWVRSFNEHDLDFLTALANFAAVGVERIREHRARTRLQRYHAPAVVDELLRSDKELAGRRMLRRAEVTVLFADLAGFSALAETSSPEEVAALLDGFCSRASDAIFAEGGTLDKLIGDCVMAFFGAPVEAPNHALQGVRAALRIQHAMRDWNDERASVGQSELKVRIGVNSGLVVVGEVGDDRRADYTVLGNTVNVAARLEQYVASPGEIIVGDATRQLIGDAFHLEPLGDVALRGLGRCVAAYRICQPTDGAAAPSGLGELVP
jgi:adenylate cyclase